MNKKTVRLVREINKDPSGVLVQAELTKDNKYPRVIQYGADLFMLSEDTRLQEAPTYFLHVPPKAEPFGAFGGGGVNEGFVKLEATRPLQQAYFDGVIARLDRSLSEFVLMKKYELDEANRQTMKHHAEDLHAAADAILGKVSAV